MTQQGFEEIVEALAKNVLKEPCDQQAQRRYDELTKALLNEKTRYDIITSTFTGNDGTEHTFEFTRTTRTRSSYVGHEDIKLPVVQEVKAYDWKTEE